MKNCDACLNNLSDDEGWRYCAYAVDLDEDEMGRLLTRDDAACPFWEPNNEYKLVQKQN